MRIGPNFALFNSTKYYCKICGEFKMYLTKIAGLNRVTDRAKIFHGYSVLPTYRIKLCLCGLHAAFY